jgi:hypothetical protein
MVGQTIIWIALPNGFDTVNGVRVAKMSVFVAPRLQDGSALSDFDFVDWPSRLANATFDIAFPTKTIRAKVTSQPRSDLWTAVFPKSMIVRSYAADTFSPVYSTYSAAALHDDVKRAHQTLSANSAVDGTAREAVSAAFGDLSSAFGPQPPPTGGAPVGFQARRLALAEGLFRPGARTRPLVDAMVDLARSEAQQAAGASSSSRPIAVVPDTGTIANRFAQFAAYHQHSRGTAAASAPTDAGGGMDFHQKLASMGDYFGLMRLLGIVIDLELDASTVPLSDPVFSSQLRLVPGLSVPLIPGTVPRTPPTAFECDGNRIFRAALSPTAIAAGEFAEGMLNLALPASQATPSVPAFRLIQVDVDSAGFHTLNLVRNAINSTASARRDDDFTPAPLRSSGLSIVQSGSAAGLLQTIANGQKKIGQVAVDPSVPLFADDLIRGFRFDVRDDVSSRWLSLHQRVGTFFAPVFSSGIPITEENCVQPALVQPPPDGSQPRATTPDPSAPNHISESLFLWQGFGLAAPRPGTMPLPSLFPTPDITMLTTFKAASRSLPRLRFGRSYQVRARIADLAGNGLTLDAANELGTKFALPGPDQSLLFQRFEPIPSPVPVFRTAQQSGETSHRIVLRSNTGISPDAFAAQQPRYRNANERHIAPPQCMESMAERFGLFDASIGTGNDLDRTYNLACRDAGSLSDLPGAPAGTPAQDGDPVHSEPKMLVTYLPDPLAAGVVFHNLPGAPDGSVLRADSGLQSTALPQLRDPTKAIRSITQLDFGPSSAWPDLLTFRLQLAEGNSAPAWNATDRVLTVFLPKGTTATARMACHPGGAPNLNLLGIQAWTAEWFDQQRTTGALSTAAATQGADAYRQLALLGSSRMLTPSRNLELVHAVQQPLAPPVLSTPPQALRYNGATCAYFNGQVKVDGDTTGEIAFVGHWTEKVDVVGIPRNLDESRATQLFTMALHRPQDTPAGTAPPPNDMIPAAQFDAATGTIRFNAPSFGGIADSLRDKAGAVIETIDDLLQDVSRLQPPKPALVKFARDLKTQAQQLRASIGPPPWQDVLLAARSISAANLNEEPGLTDLPSSVVTAGNSVDTDVAELLSALEDAIAELQRFELRQEFGDTRHRNVSYKAVATTRFRAYFPDDDSASFSLDSNEVQVNVLSTARPATPTVRYIVPTFGWQISPGTAPGAVVRRRVGGGLRVYLDRPWYSSGEGELLAVILPEAGATTPDRQRSCVSQWSRDPLTDSQPIGDFPAAASFKRSARSASGLRLPNDDNARSTVAVVGHEVKFDDSRQLYYCDIEIDAGPSYFPFVRLALARYQPDSLPGVELSRAVLADFAQLVPDRTVTLTPVAGNPDQFDLTVEGRTYLSNAWEQGETPGGRVDFKRPQAPHQDFKINAPVELVRVSVQSRIAGATDEAGWQEVAGVGARQAVMAGFQVPAQGPLWSGRVALPGNRTPGQFRIVIQESEHFRTGFVSHPLVAPDPDDGDDEGLPPGHTHPPPPQPVKLDEYVAGPRLVFADAIVI